MEWLGMAARPRAPRPELKAVVLARAYAAGRRRYAWWPLAAAATLLMAVAATAGYALWRTGQLRVERDRLAARAAALGDTLDLVRRPGTGVHHIPVVTAGKVGSITIFSDRDSQRWLVTCSGLAPNAPGEVYQIWFITEDGPRSALVMPMPDATPRIAAIGVPDAALLGVMMTVEPDSGSVQPRGPVLFEQTL